jgi:hypothetical protein
LLLDSGIVKLTIEFSYHLTPLTSPICVGMYRVSPPVSAGLPGVSIAVPYTAVGYPLDEDKNAEGNVFGPLIVTVSPMQGLYAADEKIAKQVEKELKSLF